MNETDENKERSLGEDDPSFTFGGSVAKKNMHDASD